MGLSPADIARIASFVRTAVKAPNSETVIAETFQVLKRIAKVGRVRVVHSPAPGSWTEWQAAPEGLEVRTHEEWPAPDNKGATAFFEDGAAHSGFISADRRSERAEIALNLVAPEVWAALLLRAAVDRVQKASVSEG
jgi:hypothetical protein